MPTEHRTPQQDRSAEMPPPPAGPGTDPAETGVRSTKKVENEHPKKNKIVEMIKNKEFIDTQFG